MQGYTFTIGMIMQKFNKMLKSPHTLIFFVVLSALLVNCYTEPTTNGFTPCSKRCRKFKPHSGKWEMCMEKCRAQCRAKCQKAYSRNQEKLMKCLNFCHNQRMTLTAMLR